MTDGLTRGVNVGHQRVKNNTISVHDIAGVHREIETSIIQAIPNWR